METRLWFPCIIHYGQRLDMFIEAVIFLFLILPQEKLRMGYFHGLISSCHPQLCKQIGHHVNVNGISGQLASGGAYECVVDLCLSVASQRDPAGLALNYYKNNEPADDHQGYMAFTSRFVHLKSVFFLHSIVI